MDNTQNIQWFPGHMAKTKRRIAEMLKITDAVIEIVDARIPISSRNPDLKAIIENKPLMIVLNKADMADPKITADWLDYYKSTGVFAIAFDCKSSGKSADFKNAVMRLLEGKLREYKDRGMVGKPIRLMAVGIPNVGKSSFINKISGNKSAKVENRPGVTRGNQWFTVGKQLELLDTPGVLWPKFDDKTVAEHLAFTGAVTDRILDTELLAMRLLQLLVEEYPEKITERYGVSDFSGDYYETLCAIGKKRSMLLKGGEVDAERAANMLLEEFRNCKLGRITLERVNYA